MNPIARDEAWETNLKDTTAIISRKVRELQKFVEDILGSCVVLATETQQEQGLLQMRKNNAAAKW